MEQIIDFELKSNRKTIVSRKNMVCDYILNKQISFEDDGALNIIYLNTKVYERKTKEYQMLIDFKTKVGTFIFATGEKCHFDIMAKYIQNKKNIKLIYSFEDEEKTIIINMKERENENTIN